MKLTSIVSHENMYYNISTYCTLLMYCIAGYFRRVFILGYFEKASFFKNKFFVIAKKQQVITPHVININIS